MRFNKLLADRDRTWWTDCLFLLLACSGLFFILLASRPLFVPDEGRYAEIAREMFVRGDYITPYLNGIKYFEKPALFYWLGAIFMKIGGVNLWSVRSINAIFATIGVILTYLTSRKLYNRNTGLLSASVLGTSLLYFAMAHMVSLDMPVSIFIMICLYSFILAIHEPQNRSFYIYCYLAAVSAALAVLTKGLIGIVFPALIITAWITLMGQWRLFKRLPIFTAAILFFAVATPWHLLVSLKNPEFFYFYFIEQQFLRYATMNVGHYQPVWFFIPALLLGFFPWIVFLPQAIKNSLPSSWKTRENRSSELFFLLWATFIFLFFSFSKSKLIPYILPVFPPLAILTGRYLAEAIKLRSTLSIKFSYLFLLAIACVFSYVLYSFTHNNALPDAHVAKLYFSIATAILQTGIFFAAIFCFENISATIIITIATAYFFELVMIVGIPAIDTRSIETLVHTLKPILQKNDEVITFNQYYQDLPFYLQRRVTILNWQNELSFGMAHQDTREWMIDDATFWQRWHGKRPVFVILSQSEFQNLRKKYPQETFYVLDQTINNVLMVNQPEGSER